jgi:hypothetical protein
MTDIFKRVVVINSLTVLESQNGTIARLIVGQLRNIRRAGGSVDAVSFSCTSALENGLTPDLLVLSSRTGRLPSGSCGILLVPGQAGDLSAKLRASCVVSYGMSLKDSVTMSSIDEGGLVLSVQRELPTLSGRYLERQDIPVRCQEKAPAEDVLASSAALLLLGVPPESLMS